MSSKTPEQALAEAKDAYGRAAAAFVVASDAHDAAYAEYRRVREAYIRDRKPAAQGGE